ncbi:MAG: hypothetical protein ACPG49_02510 [Chitinophagales bacterium]
MAASHYTGLFFEHETLPFHLNYYVSEVSKALGGEPLAANDKYSFDHPPIESAEDWKG